MGTAHILPANHRLPAWYETWWAYTLYILSFILIAAGVIKIYFNRLHRKQQEQLEEQLTQMKFRFFTNVSHDLRTPLTLIITPLSSLLSEIQDGKLKQQLSSIYRNAEELLQLVNQLLDFRKLEVSEEKLNLTNADIREFVTTTCEALVVCEQQADSLFSHTTETNALYVS
ncbi:MAG: histidine kinase dimerization/phospho-acceptor domain-containing protein [Bacteroides ovatus]